DAKNVTITVEIDYVLSSGATELVANNSVPGNGTGTNTSYDVTIDQAFLAAGNFGGGNLPTGEYLTTVWLSTTNPYLPGASAWTPMTIGRSVFTYYIVNPMTASFLSPGDNSTSPLGNITFSIVYAGDFVNGANLTVYSGSTPVFVQGIFHSGTGTQSVVISWPATGAGQFKAIVTLTAPGQANGLFWEWFNVSSTQSGVVTINHNSYANSTLIPGLNSAVAGTLLLIIGLIIGMIVALFLGRMMWGSPRPSAAPQQWSPKAANECSVCHQTFGTEAELKDHAKTAHGVT
ncbi:MAG: hypothetical protein L3J96_04175, partial [Thermoplasmata archaeon]|nr:hypothetical protein [Thermoplasmata archaeon]